MQLSDGNPGFGTIFAEQQPAVGDANGASEDVTVLFEGVPIGGENNGAEADGDDVALDGGVGGLSNREAGCGCIEEMLLLKGRRGGCATRMVFSTGGGAETGINGEGEETLVGRVGNCKEEIGVMDLFTLNCMLVPVIAESGAKTVGIDDGAGAAAGIDFAGKITGL